MAEPFHSGHSESRKREIDRLLREEIRVLEEEVKLLRRLLGGRVYKPTIGITVRAVPPLAPR
jgi:hypothetical protein